MVRVVVQRFVHRDWFHWVWNREASCLDVERLLPQLSNNNTVCTGIILVFLPATLGAFATTSGDPCWPNGRRQASGTSVFILLVQTVNPFYLYTRSINLFSLCHSMKAEKAIGSALYITIELVPVMPLGFSLSAWLANATLSSKVGLTGAWLLLLRVG